MYIHFSERSYQFSGPATGGQEWLTRGTRRRRFSLARLGDITTSVSDTSWAKRSRREGSSGTFFISHQESGNGRALEGNLEREREKNHMVRVGTFSQVIDLRRPERGGGLWVKMVHRL